MEKINVWSQQRGFKRLKEGITLEAYQAKYHDAIEVIEPSSDELEGMLCDGIVEALDGCSVEPDGTCHHGYPSWLIALGLC
jgi:hypothetical protein